MTKQEFLDGNYFRVNDSTRKGAASFNYANGCIARQIRSESNGEVILDDYLCNVSKITENTVSGFTYILGKKITYRLKFKDLIPVK